MQSCHALLTITFLVVWSNFRKWIDKKTAITFVKAVNLRILTVSKLYISNRSSSDFLKTSLAHAAFFSMAIRSIIS